MGRIEDDIEQSKFQNEFQKAYINLSYTYHHFTGVTSKMIKTKKITPQQYNVLRILRGSYPDSKKIGDVKKVMIDKNPDLTRLVERLLLKKYVSREMCDEDRRQVNLKISKKGLNLLESLDEEMSGWDEKLKSISVTEAKMLNGILDKWRN